MPDTHGQKSNPNPPMVYEIRVKGHLGQPLAAWFGSAAITLEEDGDTRLTCVVVDQAALHGVLKKVRDLGLPLLSVTRLESDLPEGLDEQE